jgi:hypothetical protein
LHRVSMGRGQGADFTHSGSAIPDGNFVTA